MGVNFILAFLAISAKAQNNENVPPEAECTPCHSEAPCPSGTISFLSIESCPESPSCMGVGCYPQYGYYLYFWANSESISNEVVTRYWCDNATTNCPESFSTNVYWPSFTTNWWVVDHPGYSDSGAGLGMAFTPTNCGVGTVTFFARYTNFDPVTGEPCGGEIEISITNEFTVVNVDIAEWHLVTCVGETESFSLTNTCFDVTWEIVTNGVPGEPSISS